MSYFRLFSYMLVLSCAGALGLLVQDYIYTAPPVADPIAVGAIREIDDVDAAILDSDPDAIYPGLGPMDVRGSRVALSDWMMEGSAGASLDALLRAEDDPADAQTYAAVVEDLCANDLRADACISARARVEERRRSRSLHPEAVVEAPRVVADETAAYGVIGCDPSAAGGDCNLPLFGAGGLFVKVTADRHADVDTGATRRDNGVLRVVASMFIKPHF